MATTKTNPAAQHGPLSQGEGLQLREWGSDRVFRLPRNGSQELVVGSASDAWLHLQDGDLFVSRRHAVIRRIDSVWYITDAASKNGLWIDGRRSGTSTLLPGMEVGIGRVRLIVEDETVIRDRALLARFLGWGVERATVVDRALRILQEYRASRIPLWLTGSDDLVAIARRIHAQVTPERPFKTIDLRARTRSVADALQARGATLCMWARRMPADAHKIRALLADSSEQCCNVMVCARSADQVVTIDIPTLASRDNELDRIVDEYAADAIAQLSAPQDAFTSADREWLLALRPRTLGEIEQSTLRQVAVRKYGGITNAAPRLGLTHSALSRWFSRRSLSGSVRAPGEGR